MPLDASAGGRWNRVSNVTIKVKELAEPLSESKPDLNAMRTIMAADRTLMAWIRAALGLLSFGYTIYKILQEVHEAEKAGFMREQTPRNAGVFLTLAGTVALIMGIAEYLATLRVLRPYHTFRLARPSLIMSVVMAAVGVLLSAGIIARLI